MPNHIGDWSNLKTDLAQFSVKHFFDEMNALEVNLGGGRRYAWVEANHHLNFRINQSVDWYLGYGMNLGYWATSYDRSINLSQRTGYWWGFGGIGGIEVTTNVIPLNFALDVGPAVSLIPKPELGVKVGFAARYAIK